MLVAALCLATGATAGTLQEGLVTHFAFDGNFTDSVGNITPTPVGDANTDAAGKIGSGALKFWTYKQAGEVPEGQQQFNYLALLPAEGGSDPNGVLALGTDVSFSVSFWVRFNSWSGDPSFFGNKNWNSGGNTGFVIATAGDGRLQWNYREAGGGRKDYDGPGGTLSGGRWHLVVWTVDRGGRATSYLDGVQVDSRAVATLNAEQNWTPLSVEPAGLGLNIGQDGTGSYTDGGGVGILDGELDDFGFWNRVISASEVGRIFSGGLAGVNLSAIADPKAPSVGAISPAEGALNSNPNGAFSATIENAGTALDPASVRLFLDGNLVPHTLTPAGADKTQVTYKPASVLAPASVHKYRLEFKDNGSPVASKSTEVNFTIANYTDIQLPAPLYLETFDNTPEGEIPEGWTRQNYTTGPTDNFDLDNPNSSSYLDWVVLTKERFARVFDNRRLNVAPWQVVNGQVLDTLINGSLCYGESDNRGGNQYQLLFSKDFDLTGKTDIYLSFRNIYEQNQDSLGGVEYSIDEGATWQPLLYMVDGPDINRTETGDIDPVATMTTPRGDAAKYTNPDTGETTDGRWGSFIGVTEDRYPTLAPFISARINDNAVEGKRVEVLRMPLADNQPKVRLRFAHSGTGSWYFGIDDVGLYSFAPTALPSISISASGVITFSGGRLQSAPSVNGPWTDVNVATSPYTPERSGAAGYFRGIR